MLLLGFPHQLLHRAGLTGEGELGVERRPGHRVPKEPLPIEQVSLANDVGLNTHDVAIGLRATDREQHEHRQHRERRDIR